MDAPATPRRKRTNSDADADASPSRTAKRSRLMLPPPPPPTPAPVLTLPEYAPLSYSRLTGLIEPIAAVTAPEYRLANASPSRRPPSSVASSSGSGPSRDSVLVFRSSGMHALTRSASFSSLHHVPDPSKPFPDGSAGTNLRMTRLNMDFSLSAPVPDATATTPNTTANANAATTPTRRIVPLSYSSNNVVYFSRGTRVHCRPMANISSNADITQICRLQDHHGELVVLKAGGADQRPGIFALTTTSGNIQLWDTEAKKLVTSWSSSKGAVSLAWNGAVVTVGTNKGGVRSYDTRIQPAAKMKEQATRTTRTTRHQAPIGALEWNVDGRYLASGDENGLVLTWDVRSPKKPLDVGAFNQSRRKRMQHAGPVSALCWSPWQPKLLATGDTTGTVKFWTVDASNTSSNVAKPNQFYTGSEIVGLHFATNVKEFLVAAGPPATRKPDNDVLSPHTGRHERYSNSIAVYSFPTLRPVARQSVVVSDSAHTVAGSVLSPTTVNAAQRLVVAVPEEGKLKVVDVWGKLPQVRRQSSFLDLAIR
ncbi:WD-REPEATS-REGION domain-containing protein [Mycena kentingensis (nom. inval.)]|nr:WD-REPEATS-REGION domain-containing protein [Mycena kentingensis (nom. inval.)]